MPTTVKWGQVIDMIVVFTIYRATRPTPPALPVLAITRALDIGGSVAATVAGLDGSVAMALGARLVWIIALPLRDALQPLFVVVLVPLRVILHYLAVVILSVLCVARLARRLQPAFTVRAFVELAHHLRLAAFCTAFCDLWLF